ncbi:hypothetical protein DERF_000934 [Dermatophagoides farinae]|uniref:Uncharacterized protein n=1 Tax=Dermatophagoides farinae TaxID=6954 RepID=A0A922I8F6_DERFA|nr:hypothetical protein DERF_000934 [Dermatophagoides farinae]
MLESRLTSNYEQFSSVLLELIYRLTMYINLTSSVSGDPIFWETEIAKKYHGCNSASLQVNRFETSTGILI